MNPSRSSRVRLIALAGSALWAATVGSPAVHAQTDPNIARGFAPDKVYSFSELDSISLLNGNLSLRIPIGGSYPVNAGLSYGLTLTYNSNVWDFESVTRRIGQVTNSYTLALPDRASNAGLGWRLSLGDVLLPNTYGSPNWRYLDPDGGEHVFYTTRHVGEILTAGVFYSRDGSDLRLKILTSGSTGKPLTVEIELPDGSIRKFSRTKETDPLRLTQIRDRYANAVNVAYTLDPVTGKVTRWTLTDGHRTHYVNFVTQTNGEQVVSSVDLAAFQSQRAVYGFAYTANTIDRSCLHDDPTTPNTVAVNLLSTVSLPDSNGTFAFAAYNTACRNGASTVLNIPGTLGRMTLPTLGRVEWTYQTYSYPARTAQGCAPGSGPGLSIQQVAGVATKRMLDAGGICKTWDGVGCQWTYAQGGTTSTRQTTVTLPTGDQTVHYFNTGVALNNTTWDGWQYGLPIHPTINDGAGRYLSEETFDGGVKVRSTYRRYEHDKLPTSKCYPDQWYDTNRRVASEKTVYPQDGSRYAEVTHSENDGLGHYRRSVTSGSFGAGDVRTVFTNFNPAYGIYNINPATNNGAGNHNYTPFATSSVWVLGTFSERTQTEGGVTAKQEFCHQGSTGFLLRERTYKAAAIGGNDVVKLYTKNSVGNLTQEEWFGGDNQTVGTTALCSLALPANRYRVDHTYAFGARATSRWIDGAGANLPFLSLDLTLDANTALPKIRRDVSAIVTNLEYDLLGRPTWEKPSTGHGSWIQYVWLPATSATALANVKVSSRPNGSSTGSIAESRIYFDDFGRVAQEKVLGADGQWSTVETVYHSLGWKRSVSERQLGTPTSLTVFKEYDPFGRPGLIKPPGGASDVELTYYGVREVLRKAKVWDGTSEVLRTTTERYDRQGRLYQVVEPAGPAAANVTTTYGYDVGGRLSSVSQPSGGTTQSRTFTYDHRGFLTQEKHPEKGASGNGWIYYYGYEPLGNVGRKVDGLADLIYLYDRASRLTLVRETGGAQRTLKAFTYGGANAAGDKRLGRLWTADRYNYVIVNSSPFTVQVKETYVYGGPAGATTSRATDTWVNGGATESFTQGWAYDDLGAVTTLTYPRCTHTGCTGAAATSRSVTQTYVNGFLTAVPGYATSISYHPNGMVNQVVHANGVTWTQAADSLGRRRPGSYATTGASTNWTSGTYSWDGSGNVKSIGASAFTYDGVSRLLSGTVSTLENGTSATGLKTQSYTYDGFGNLTQVTGTPGRTIPVTASTNRLTAVNDGDGVCEATETYYDAAGNLICWMGNRYDFDELGANLEKYVPAGQATDYNYLYTADDERLWVFQPANPGRWTVRDLDGKVLRELKNNAGVWSVERDYVYRNGVTLAAVQPTAEVYHHHPDHLGSPRLITGNGGTKKAFHAYYPFGEEATAINLDGERMKFTAHERDLGVTTNAADDLDYMHARYYNPQVGRFMAVDPAAQRRAHPRPQSWNRYAYGRGNPLNLIDPDGREVVPPTDRRTMNALEKLLRTRAGRAAYDALESAPGVYRFSVTRSRLTPVEERQLRAGNTVTKAGGHFTPNYVVAEGKVQWRSGGTLNIDYGVVDRAADQPYAGRHGDPALLAHEVGHAVDYEEDSERFVGLSYDEQEESADELRDNVVEELVEQRRRPRRPRRRSGSDPFAGTGFCSADNICY